MKVKGATGAEALLRLLSGMGVDRIFASPGSEWGPIWESLANRELTDKPTYLSARHEEIAVSMASGYTKSSGKLAAVMVHTTVGSLHASMALRGALHENVPMVVLAGESIAFGETPGPDLGTHWLSQLADIGGPARLVERCVKWSFAVNTKAVLPSTIQRACQMAMTDPKGPVFVSLPLEFLFGRTPIDAPAQSAIPIPATADSRGLDRLADMLLDAERPVIVTEECGRSTVAVERLVEISELLSIPVVESRTASYLNFPRTHRLHAGFESADIVGEADLVLLIATIAPWHPASMGPSAGARVAVLDENPLRGDLPFWGYQADLCLPGSIESSLARLLKRLHARGHKPDQVRSAFAERWNGLHRDRTRVEREEALACRSQQPMDPRWVLHELNQVLPADAILVEETITDRAAINLHLDRLTPGHFFAGAIGGLGTGLGTALGVKCACPWAPVILLIGDGSFNYNPVPAGLGFAQEHAMPIMIIVMNNHGYLSQKQSVPRHYPDGWAVRTKTFVGTSIMPAPDYAAMAGLFGGHGETVERPDEVRSALERGLQALAAGSIALVDMRLKPVN
ncbi:MAG TPA: thiamine pyrophosphate-binding protein [Xanthobacteraceae bacterium]|jgi:acetolactate synthase-1/2/3 large subunit